MDDPLLGWARRLAAIAQTGLAFDPGVFDRQRYEELLALAAEMSAWPDRDPAPISELFAAERGYATPKVVCRGAVFDDTRILMVREVVDGRWTLPGGWVDVGDGPAASVEREVREETGLRVSAGKLAALVDKNAHPHPPVPHHSYILFFLCDRIDGTLRTSVETSDVGWFGEDELPELSTHRTTAGQIQRMFDHHRDPSRPTDFD